MRKLLSTLLILNLLGVPALAQDVASVAMPPIDANGVFNPQGTVPAESPAEAYNRARAAGATPAEAQAEAERARVAYEAEANAYAARDQAARRAAAAGQPTPYQREQRQQAFTAIGVTGIIVMVIGLALVVPPGEEFDVFGDKFCVTNDYKTYRDGSCSVSDHRKQIGTGFLLVGAGLFTVGIVGVSANASKQGFSASGTVKW